MGKMTREGGLKCERNPSVLRLGASGGHGAQEGSVWAGGEPLDTPERLAGHQQGAGGVRLKLHREHLLREEPRDEIKQNFRGTKSKDKKKNVLWRHTLDKPKAS